MSKRIFVHYESVAGSGCAFYNVPLQQSFELTRILVLQNTAAVNGGGVSVDLEKVSSGFHFNDTKKLPAELVQTISRKTGKNILIGDHLDFSNILLTAGDGLILNIDSKGIASSSCQVLFVGYKIGAE